MSTTKVAVLVERSSLGSWADEVTAARGAELIAAFVAEPGAGGERLPGGVRTYDDGRSLIVESAAHGAELLITDFAPDDLAEWLPLAAERKMCVVSEATRVRSAEELLHLCRVFDEHEARWILGQSPGAREAIGDAIDGNTTAGRICAATLSVWTEAGADGWRGDSHRAGGGTLLIDGSGPLSLLVAALGMPERVQGERCRFAPGKTAPRHDTEDFAALTIRFEGGRSAGVTVCRGRPTSGWRLVLHGEHADVVLALGKGVRSPAERIWSATAKALRREVLRTGLDHVAKRRAVDPSERKHWQWALALVHAAELSTKTGQAESPAKMLELSGA